MRTGPREVNSKVLEENSAVLDEISVDLELSSELALDTEQTLVQTEGVRQPPSWAFSSTLCEFMQIRGLEPQSRDLEFFRAPSVGRAGTEQVLAGPELDLAVTELVLAGAELVLLVLLDKEEVAGGRGGGGGGSGRALGWLWFCRGSGLELAWLLLLLLCSWAWPRSWFLRSWFSWLSRSS